MGAYEEEIWHLCDGEHSVNDIVDIVVNKYHINREKAFLEIAAFLNKLVERELMSL
jgi:hypothetical protein